MNETEERVTYIFVFILFHIIVCVTIPVKKERHTLNSICSVNSWEMHTGNNKITSSNNAVFVHVIGRSNTEAPNKTPSASQPSSPTDTTSFSFSYSSAATIFCFFDKLKLKSTKICFIIACSMSIPAHNERWQLFLRQWPWLVELRAADQS